MESKISSIWSYVKKIAGGLDTRNIGAGGLDTRNIGEAMVLGVRYQESVKRSFLVFEFLLCTSSFLRKNFPEILCVCLFLYSFFKI